MRGTSKPKARKFSGGFQVRSTSAVVAAQLDHRDVGDREGEHRAEGVHRRQEVGLARDQGDHRDRGEDEDRDVGGAVARVDLAQALGQLAVLSHRVGEAGDPDQAGVGGDQQDHGGEDADVDAQCFGRAGAEAEVLDDAEDRVAREFGAERGRVLAGGVLDDRHRREGDDSGSAGRAPSTAMTVRPTLRGIVRAASFASSAMLEIVSIPV